MRRLNILFIVFLVITSLKFFGANFLDDSILNYLHYFFSIMACLISIPYFLAKEEGFVLPIRIIVISIIFSIIMATYSWDQPIFISIIYTSPLLIWIFFFYLRHIEISIGTIEKIVLLYTLIYIILYFYQFTHSSTVLFGNEEEFSVQRGIVRIIFPGGGIFFLGVFIALNKLTTESKRKWFWILVCFLGLVIPLMQVTRQFIAGITLIYLFHFIKRQSILARVMIIGTFIITIVTVIQSDIPIVNGLIEAQKQTKSDGQDNIRILAAEFFLTEFSPTDGSKIFGNGVPAAAGVSSYGNYVTTLFDVGFFLEDVGLIGFYVFFGVFGILGYFIIWIKSFSLPVPEKFYYVKYYLWFLLATSFTSNLLYHPYYLISTVLTLYIYQKIYIRKQISLPIPVVSKRLYD